MVGTWEENVETVVYTDYSGLSDRIAYFAVKRCRNTGEEYVYKYGTERVSTKHSQKSSQAELEGVLLAMRLFPDARIKTDNMHAVRESGSRRVEHVRGHAGVFGNVQADYLAKYGRLHPRYRITWY